MAVCAHRASHVYRAGAYLRARVVRAMDTLHADFSPYLVELGMESGGKRKADDPVDMYQHMRTERERRAAQYTAMRAIVTMFQDLSDRASLPIWPLRGQIQTAMYAWDGGYKTRWFQQYSQELRVMTMQIRRFVTALQFDPIGTRFGVELTAIEGPINAMIVRIDAMTTGVSEASYDTDTAIVGDLTAFKSAIAELVTRSRCDLNRAGYWY